MSKKSTTASDEATSATANAQENLNQLYTAHQVHTLAQLIFQRLAGEWQTQTGWMPAMGAPMAPPMSPSMSPPIGGANPVLGSGYLQGGAQPVLYWYP